VVDRDDEGSKSEAPSPGSTGVHGRTATRQPGRYWLPLLVFGGLAAVSLPLSTLGVQQWSGETGIFEITINYPTVTQAMYLGGGSAFGPSPFPLGWYWVGVLVAGLLLTAAWYHWLDRRGHSRTPLRGYLAIGLGLAVVTAALPLLAWGKPFPMGSDTGLRTWAWLEVFWQLGTFALLSVAVGLGMLAWIEHSRVLALVTALYTAAVCLAGWAELREPGLLPGFAPGGHRARLLPATILLLAGLGAMAASLNGLRSRQAESQSPPGRSWAGGAELRTRSG
jgi:hypothetical protein